MAGETLRSKSELTQRVISALIMAVAAIFADWWGEWPFALLWCALAVAVAYEWGRIVSPARAGFLAALVGGIGSVIVISTLLPETAPYALLSGLGGILATFLFARDAARGWLATGTAYCFALAFSTVLVRGEGQLGFVAILYLFAVVWMTDIGAYFAGRTIGGPKFAPRISPKKTWSGVIGGLIAGTGCGLAVLAGAGLGIKAPHVLLSLALGVTVVFGDLFESFLKRRFGVKDAGSIIPGHGGILDRLDGFTLAVTLAALIGFARGGWRDVPGGLLGW